MDHQLIKNLRTSNPRHHLLGDEELIESHSKPAEIIPRLYSTINNIKVSEKGHIESFSSHEGETVTLIKPANLENFHSIVQETLKSDFNEALKNWNFDEDWILRHYQQSVLLVSRIKWIQLIEAAITGNDLFGAQEKIRDHLNILLEIANCSLNEFKTATVQNLINQLLSYSDWVDELRKESVDCLEHPTWSNKLKHKLCKNSGEVFVEQGIAKLKYTWNYIGTGQTVILGPNLERAILSLTQALASNAHPQLRGPAGTGKTECVVTLGRLLGRECFVFNCDDQFNHDILNNYINMVSQVGGFLILDEFNRADAKNLSNLAKSLNDFLEKNSQRKTELYNDHPAVFSTVNPGYAGRSELPKEFDAFVKFHDVKVNCRNVLIRYLFYQLGFFNAESLSKSLSSVLQACQDKLSCQLQYDFGLRAFVRIIRFTKTIKSTQNLDETSSLIEALKLIFEAKMTSNDSSVFEGILSSVFPGYITASQRGRVNKIIEIFTEHKLNISEYQANQVNRFALALRDHHSFILDGVSQEFKDVAIKAARQIFESAQENEIKIHEFKTETPVQLYGNFNSNGQYEDGSLPKAFKAASKENADGHHWWVFSLQLSPLWTENMNSLIDENRLLFLANGERIKLSTNGKIIFTGSGVDSHPKTARRCKVFNLADNEDLPNYLPQHQKERISKIIELFQCEGLTISKHQARQVNQFSHAIRHHHSFILEGVNEEFKEVAVRVAQILYTKSTDNEVKVHEFKTETPVQLYGNFNSNDQYEDGTLPKAFRHAHKENADGHNWWVFSIPMSVMWMENINPLLDENRVLALANGEHVKLTTNGKIILTGSGFENAPKTSVRRCMVFNFADPVPTCQKARIPKIIELFKEHKITINEYQAKKVNDFITALDQHHSFIIEGENQEFKEVAVKVAAQIYDSANVKVHEFKTQTAAELYGTVNSELHFTDGTFSKALRTANNENWNGHNWWVFSLAVSPLWIENLNTLIEDYRVLTLASGERINLTRNSKIIFIGSGAENGPITAKRRCISFNLEEKSDPQCERIARIIELFKNHKQTITEHQAKRVSQFASALANHHAFLINGLSQEFREVVVKVAGEIYGCAKQQDLKIHEFKTGSPVELYGKLNDKKEFEDGTVSKAFRTAKNENSNGHNWWVFSIALNPLWIENLNTVLDDNKRLCLASGEVIHLTQNARVIFNGQGIENLSPATLSRCIVFNFDDGSKSLVRAHAKKVVHMLENSKLLGGLSEDQLKLVSPLILVHAAVKARSDYGRAGWKSEPNFGDFEVLWGLRLLKLASGSNLASEFGDLLWRSVYGGKVTDDEDLKNLEQIVKRIIGNRHYQKKWLEVEEKLPAEDDLTMLNI